MKVAEEQMRKSDDFLYSGRSSSRWTYSNSSVVVERQVIPADPEPAEVLRAEASRRGLRLQVVGGELIVGRDASKH